MSKHATPRYTNQYPKTRSALRTRTAVVAAGMGVSLALGAGTATAADGSGNIALTALTSGVGDAVTAQADAQQKAGDEEKKAAAEKANSWVTPVDSYSLGSTFGLAGGLWSHNHSGQDFVVPSGTPVKAAHGGTVVKAGPNGGGDGPAYGNAVVIRHADNTYTQYAHLTSAQVRVGQAVETGQQIALSGSTGNSTGPHLHFEVRTSPNYGSGVEPVDFLRNHGDSV
jgi:murein DD-endopeptidase MepM/ murein hydrolase activator NlpD